MSEADKILRVGVVVDPTDAQSGSTEVVKSFDDIARAAQQQANQVRSAWAKAWDIIKTGAIAMGASFGAFRLTSLIRESVELAARFETLGVVMRSVGGDAGYSAGFLNQLERDLRKTGISMRESRQTIISMVQAQLNLADATKLARVAQNAAVTANLNSSETLNRLMIAVQSGNSIIARTIGLQVNWEKAYNDLALTLGKSAGALTQTEKAQARVNAVMEAGVPVAKAYEAAMGTANKQLGSAQRYMEDFKVSLGGAFSDTYRYAVFAYAEQLQNLTKWVSDNGPLLQGLVTFVSYLGIVTAGLYLARTAVIAVNTSFLTLWRTMLASPMAPWIALATLAATIAGVNAKKSREAADAQEEYNQSLQRLTPRQLDSFAANVEKRLERQKTQLEQARTALGALNRRDYGFGSDAYNVELSRLQREVRDGEALVSRTNVLLTNLRQFRAQSSGSAASVQAGKDWVRTKADLEQMLFDASQPSGIQALQRKLQNMRTEIAENINKGLLDQSALTEFNKKADEIIRETRREKMVEFNAQRAAMAQEIADQQRINALWAGGARNVEALAQALELERQIKEKTRNLDRDLGAGSAERVASEMRERARVQREGQQAQTLSAQRAALADAQALRNAAASGAEAVDREKRAIENRNLVYQQASVLGFQLSLVYTAIANAIKTLDQQTANATAIEALDQRIDRLRREATAMRQGTEELKKRRREEDLQDQMRAYRRSNPNLSGDDIKRYEEALRKVAGLEQANAKYEQQVADSEGRVREIRMNTLRQLQQSFSDGIATTLAAGEKGWQTFLQNVKNMFLRLVADLLSAELMKKLVKVLFPNDRTLAQQMFGAATVMNQAANTNLKAAVIMAKASGNNAAAAGSGTTPDSAIGSTGNKIMGSLAIAATAYTAGNMLGGLTKDKTVGALAGAAGGAASGAVIGNFLLPGVGAPLGAAVGGVMGFVGGLLGSRRAAKEAADELKRFREASTALQASIAILRIKTAGGNASLQEALEQNRRYFEQLDKDIKGTYKGKKHEDERRRLLAESDRLEASEATRIRSEYARKQREVGEDMQVRALRARSLNREADAMALAAEQQREYEAAVREGFTDAMLSQLRYVHALEKVKQATEGAAAGLLNAPTGFKIALERFTATAVQFMPSLLGYQPGDGAASADGPTEVVLVLDGKAVAKGVVQQLKRQSQTQFGTSLRWAEVQP